MKGEATPLWMLDLRAKPRPARAPRRKRLSLRPDWTASLRGETSPSIHLRRYFRTHPVLSAALLVAPVFMEFLLQKAEQK